MIVLNSALTHLSLLASVVAAAAAPPGAPGDTTTHRLLSKAGDCRFSSHGHLYNLCPLFGDTKSGLTAAGWGVGLSQRTPPTVTEINYSFSFGGPLEKDASVPDHEQCPEGTWACMKVKNRRPKHEDEAPRVIQVIPIVANFSDPSSVPAASADREHFGIYAQAFRKTEKALPSLRLRMYGGYYVDKPQRAIVNLVCDPKAHIDGPSPTFDWSWNGTYAFTWTVKHACAVGHTKSHPPPPAQDDEAPPEDASPPEDELLPPLSDRVSSRSITMVLLITSATLFGLGYLALHPPPILRRRAAPLVRAWRRSRFRSAISESKLMRWAEEDLAMMDEDDEMVNAHDEADFDVLDEQIPLKLSPRVSFANYGSARRD